MESERNHAMEEFFMRKALDVAESALQVGEVPVGCVIVLREASENESNSSASSRPRPVEGAEQDKEQQKQKPNSSDNYNGYNYESSPEVIVSHGANQVNATRDATRHAECIAIDRMLTGGMMSDQSRLPQQVIVKAAHGKAPDSFDKERFHDDWINIHAKDDNDNGNEKCGSTKHWKNEYGFGSGKLFKREIFKKCDLYVTCEPCIMCAAALAKVGIGRVVYGCKNGRFGGNGSLLSLHLESALPSKSHLGYPIVTGVLEDEAITLLRSFYDRENFHAPDDKRKRKPAAPASAPAPATPVNAENDLKR